MTRHVEPVNDLRAHDTSQGVFCPCMPRLLRTPAADEADGDLVVHNSYDGREIGEVCFAALDALALALAGHSHTWTADERDVYEHAILVLSMHHPRLEASR